MAVRFSGSRALGDPASDITDVFAFLNQVPAEQLELVRFPFPLHVH